MIILNDIFLFILIPIIAVLCISFLIFIFKYLKDIKVDLKDIALLVNGTVVSPYQIRYYYNKFLINLFFTVGSDYITEKTTIEINLDSSFVKKLNKIAEDFAIEETLKNKNEKYLVLFLSDEFQEKIIKFKNLRPDIFFQKDKIKIVVYKNDKDFKNIVNLANIYCDELDKYRT